MLFESGSSDCTLLEKDYLLVQYKAKEYQEAFPYEETLLLKRVLAERLRPSRHEAFCHEFIYTNNVCG